MPSTSGNIAITLVPQENGSFVCEVVPTLEGQVIPPAKHHGQSPNHAIAIALEKLAHSFRNEAALDQEIGRQAANSAPCEE